MKERKEMNVKVFMRIIEKGKIGKK